MHLDIYSDAADFVQTLDAKRFRQVVSKILNLANDPKPQDSQELKGYPFSRVDVGEYRIIYAYDDYVLTVVIVGKRNDDEVYKELKRKYSQA